MRTRVMEIAGSRKTGKGTAAPEQPGLLIHTSARMSTPRPLFRQWILKTVLKRSLSLLNEVQWSFKNSAATYCISGEQSSWAEYFKVVFWERCGLEPAMQLATLENGVAQDGCMNSPSAHFFEVSQGCAIPAWDHGCSDRGLPLASESEEHG